MTIERLDLGEDDGYLDVVLAGKEYRIDAWEANDLIYDYAAANKDQKGAAFYRGLAQELSKLGLPLLSNELVPALMRGVNGKVERLKKKAPPAVCAPPDCPDSTASTPGPSGPSNSASTNT